MPGRQPGSAGDPGRFTLLVSPGEVVPKPKGGLTPRQRRFVEEYLLDGIGAAAARRAGYKAHSSGDYAAQLLGLPQIQAAIQAAKSAQAERLKIKADDVIRELVRVGTSDIGQILDFTGDVPRLRTAREIPEDARRAISSVKVRRYVEGEGDEAKVVEVTEFKLWDKVSALEKLGKHFSLFKEILEHSGREGKPIEQVVVYIPDNGRGAQPSPAAPPPAPAAPPAATS